MVIYSKYHIKYTLSDEFHNTLSWVFLIFTLSFFVSALSVKYFVKMIDKLQEKRLNPAFEEAKLRKGKRYAGMNFIYKQFNFELEYFKDELEKIGMDKQDRGSIQVAFAAVLLKHEDNFENVSFRSKIYFYIGEILGIQLSTVELNIGNCLKKKKNAKIFCSIAVTVDLMQAFSHDYEFIKSINTLIPSSRIKCGDLLIETQKSIHCDYMLPLVFKVSFIDEKISILHCFDSLISNDIVEFSKNTSLAIIPIGIAKGVSLDSGLEFTNRLHSKRFLTNYFKSTKEMIAFSKVSDNN